MRRVIFEVWDRTQGVMGFPGLVHGGRGTVGQDVVELICQNARKTRKNEAMAL